MQKVKKKKRVVRRRLKKEAVFILAALVLFIYICFNIPGMLTNNKLAKLGYDKEAVAAIKEYKLTDTLLENQWYSSHLNSAIKQEDFREDLLEIYLVTDSLNEDDLLLYDKLSKTYTKEDMIALYADLSFKEMTPLLVFDKVETIKEYINDVKANRAQNLEQFVLSGTYLTPYKNTEPVNNPGSVDMLINKHFYLSESYIPGDLVEMSVQYASKGVKLSNTAYEPFKEMANAMKAVGLNMYASSTYRDYSYQVELYEDYVKRDGEEVADTFAARPGHSEHQTGLTADLATSSGGLKKFGESKEYQWMIENAHHYGWILRYPVGKECITGYEAEPWHWRYVGKDLAEKVVQSGLSYDEYYMLYLN